MLYDMFLEVMVNKVKEFLPEQWENANIVIRASEKVNQQRKGISFDRPDKRTNPTIYMEEFYERYQKGEDLDEIAEEIIYTLKEIETHSFETFSTEFLENNDDKILFELVNTKENEALLADRPHREFQDLSVIYYWIVSRDEDGTMTLPITNTISEKLELPEERLYELAMENTRQTFPFVVKPMVQVVAELVSDIPEELKDLSELEQEVPIYVLTNDIRNAGSVVMLYPEVIHELSEEIGKDLYLMPASRHEMIAIPKGTKELGELVELVCEVNMSLLQTEEILSYQVYQYDREAREVTMATNEPHRPFRQGEAQVNKLEGKERSTGR